MPGSDRVVVQHVERGRHRAAASRARCARSRRGACVPTVGSATHADPSVLGRPGARGSSSARTPSPRARVRPSARRAPRRGARYRRTWRARRGAPIIAIPERSLTAAPASRVDRRASRARWPAASNADSAFAAPRGPSRTRGRGRRRTGAAPRRARPGRRAGRWRRRRPGRSARGARRARSPPPAPRAPKASSTASGMFSYQRDGTAATAASAEQVERPRRSAGARGTGPGPPAGAARGLRAPRARGRRRRRRARAPGIADDRVDERVDALLARTAGPRTPRRRPGVSFGAIAAASTKFGSAPEPVGEHPALAHLRSSRNRLGQTNRRTGRYAPASVCAVSSTALTALAASEPSLQRRSIGSQNRCGRQRFADLAVVEEPVGRARELVVVQGHHGRDAAPPDGARGSTARAGGRCCAGGRRRGGTPSSTPSIPVAALRDHMHPAGAGEPSRRGHRGGGSRSIRGTGTTARSGIGSFSACAIPKNVDLVAGVALQRRPRRTCSPRRRRAGRGTC